MAEFIKNAGAEKFGNAYNDEMLNVGTFKFNVEHIKNNDPTTILKTMLYDKRTYIQLKRSLI